MLFIKKNSNNHFQDFLTLTLGSVLLKFQVKVLKIKDFIRENLGKISTISKY